MTTHQPPGRGAAVQETPREAHRGPGPVFAIRVFGTPAPQGSKNAFRNQYTGRIQQVESSKKVKPWREAVRSTVADALALVDDWHPLDCPLELDMVFTLTKPASAPKRRTWPMRTPDLSKLARSTEDALKDAGLYADDARIVRYRTLAKVYPLEDVDALPSPGVLLRVWEVSTS
jgi:Holliday junction resolvase RusA-like endonuclease